MVRPALVTGFMPYGGRGVRSGRWRSPAALDGGTLADTPVVSRLLPVSFVKIAGMAETLLRDVNPCIVISLGLWPGESLIRVERAALNVADFEIPDNVGYVAADEPVLHDNGAAAKLATVPVRAMVDALLDAGIPARISNTAGTYLCNACLYSFLSAAGGRRPSGSPAASFMFPTCPARWRISCAGSRMREFWSSTSAPTPRPWNWRPASAARLELAIAACNTKRSIGGLRHMADAILELDRPDEAVRTDGDRRPAVVDRQPRGVLHLPRSERIGKSTILHA